jgi:hypothetical protein
MKSTWSKSPHKPVPEPHRVPTSPFGMIERFGCFAFYEVLYSEVKVKVAYQVG